MRVVQQLRWRRVVEDLLWTRDVTLARYGVAGILHISAHGFAVVYFTLVNILQVIHPPYWTNIVVSLVNLAGVFRSLRLAARARAAFQ